MKRSDAIQEITNAIINALGADPDTGEVLLPNDLSYLGSAVLNKCEELGMLPPHRAVGPFDANNTWRPEDEKK